MKHKISARKALQISIRPGSRFDVNSQPFFPLSKRPSVRPLKEPRAFPFSLPLGHFCCFRQRFFPVLIIYLKGSHRSKSRRMEYKARRDLLHSHTQTLRLLEKDGGRTPVKGKAKKISPRLSFFTLEFDRLVYKGIGSPASTHTVRMT